MIRTTPTLTQRLKLIFNCLRNTYMGVWVVLSAALVLTLHLTLHRLFGLAEFLGTSAPIQAYSFYATGVTCLLLGLIVVLGSLCAHRLSTAEQILKHALRSVQEGDLSTRIDLGSFEGREDLEVAVNEAMEVVQHRIERVTK